jgi:hypothetical protein
VGTLPGYAAQIAQARNSEMPIGKSFQPRTIPRTGRSSSFSDADADSCAASSVSHGVFDALHASVIDNPGGPAFRPSFCLAFDVIAAVVLAFLSSGARSAAFHSNLIARS